MTKMEAIGLRIRTMRMSRKMTQSDLANAINQSQSSITMYETGRREPDFETLEALADVFNVPLASIVSDAESSSDDEPKNDDIRLLVRGLNQLTPEQVEQAKNVMKAMFAQYADYFDKGE